MTPEDLNLMGRRILDAGFAVHSELGPGLPESTYTASFVSELRKIGLDAKTDVPVPAVHDEVKPTDVAFRIDILVENEIVIEMKSLEAISRDHLYELASNLELSGYRLGFLLNFNVASFRDGIYRRVNGF